MPDKRTKIAGAIVAGMIAVGGGLGGAYMADKAGEKPKSVDAVTPVKPHKAEACVIVDHPDKSRIGEVITVQKPGFKWGDFERGKVTINGIRLSIKRVDERPNPGDVACGKVTFSAGKFAGKKGRCDPPEVVSEDMP